METSPRVGAFLFLTPLSCSPSIRGAEKAAARAARQVPRAAHLLICAAHVWRLSPLLCANPPPAM